MQAYHQDESAENCLRVPWMCWWQSSKAILFHTCKDTERTQHGTRFFLLSGTSSCTKGQAWFRFSLVARWNSKQCLLHSAVPTWRHWDLKAPTCQRNRTSTFSFPQSSTSSRGHTVNMQSTTTLSVNSLTHTITLSITTTYTHCSCTLKSSADLSSNFFIFAITNKCHPSDNLRKG